MAVSNTKNYLLTLLGGLICSFGTACSNNSLYAVKKASVVPDEAGSKHFRNKPRQEYVFINDSCVCQRNLFSQFAAQFRAAHPGPPLHKPFASVLGVKALVQLSPCSGLYYFYNLRILQAKWRGNPVFDHDVFVVRGSSLTFFTKDSIQNHRLVKSLRSQALFDSLKNYPGVLSTGKVFIHY
ncbi:hypothetical protein [Hymenobacter guriensis]|uniref:Lipoprotein n=1 Tax=Hymenobacter guriensis TaxID=2793065 RepID=A0ABS0L487_9BACT|nr:hypothetical protein [Hymenobacter guriensis]MBG8554913.1 hypothetical protein [Hymenobacter guriensis]